MSNIIEDNYLMFLFNEIKNKIHEMTDKYTIELLKIIGIQLTEHYTIWDVICAKNLLENKGYKLLYFNNDGINEITLYKGDDFISGYQFIIVTNKIDNDSIEIKPVKILNRQE